MGLQCVSSRPSVLKIPFSNNSIFGCERGAKATNVCEVNLPPRTVYLIAAVPETQDEEEERLTVLERAWPRCERSKHAGGERGQIRKPYPHHPPPPRSVSQSIKVSARKWDYLTDTLEAMQPVIYAVALQMWNTSRNVIKARLLVHLRFSKHPRVSPKYYKDFNLLSATSGDLSDDLFCSNQLPCLCIQLIHWHQTCTIHHSVYSEQHTVSRSDNHSTKRTTQKHDTQSNVCLEPMTSCSPSPQRDRVARLQASEWWKRWNLSLWIS